MERVHPFGYVRTRTLETMPRKWGYHTWKLGRKQGRCMYKNELLKILYDSESMELHPIEVNILAVIAYHAELPDIPVPISVMKIANCSKLSTSTILRHMSQLIKKRFLIKTKEHTQTLPAQYLINEERLLGIRAHYKLKEPQ